MNSRLGKKTKTKTKTKNFSTLSSSLRRFTTSLLEEGKEKYSPANNDAIVEDIIVVAPEHKTQATTIIDIGGRHGGCFIKLSRGNTCITLRWTVVRLKKLLSFHISLPVFIDQAIFIRVVIREDHKQAPRGCNDAPYCISCITTISTLFELETRGWSQIKY